MSDPIYKTVSIKAASDLAARREFRARITTRDSDRHGDQIEPSGMDLAPWLNTGGPMLAGHDSSKAIASVVPGSIDRTADHIDASFRFPDVGVSAQADETLGLIQAGIVSAVSVGFLPKEAKALRDEDGAYLGQHFTATELVEVSVTAVPANASAVVLAKSHEGGPAMESNIQAPHTVETLIEPPAEVARKSLQPGPSIRTSKDAEHRVYNVNRALDGMLSGHLEGLEAEIHDETVRRSGRSYRGVAVPLGAIFKAGDTGTGTGGELSWVDQRPDLLFDDPGAIRHQLEAGLVGQVITTMRESITVPSFTDRLAAGMTAKDASATDGTEIATASVTITPKYVTSGVTINRSALKYTEPALLDIYRNDIRSAAADALDTQILFGDGVTVNILGFFDDSRSFGTSAVSGALAKDDIQTVKNRLLSSWKNAGVDASSYRLYMHQRLQDEARFINVTAEVGAYHPLMGEALNVASGISALGLPVVASTRIPVTSGTPDTTVLYAVKSDELYTVLFGAIDLVEDRTSQALTGGHTNIGIYIDANSWVRSVEAIEELTAIEIPVIA